MRTILLLDDEPFILKALSRLMMEEDDWEVDTFLSAAEALEALKNKDYEVIVSDMRMPEMSGDRFLAQAAEIQPRSVRIILSAYAEKELILNAVNNGKIWTYHQKPWENDELILLIKNALDYYEKESENLRLTEKLSQMNEELERLVEEKTQILQIREKAFSNILSHQSPEQVLEELLLDIQKYCHDGLVEINDEAKAQSIELSHPSSSKQFLCYHGKSAETFERIVENFKSPLTMVLSFKSLQQSPIDLDEIDKLIDSI